MSHVAEAPKTHVKSELLASRPGFKIIRMSVPDGEELPTHAAAMNVAIVVVAGEGRVTIGDKTLAAAPGSVFEVPPGAPHSVFADQTLDLVVVQA